MLVLSRKSHQELVIDGDIRITVLEITGNHVRLGISAPATVRVLRGELLDREADQVVVPCREEAECRELHCKTDAVAGSH